MKRFIFPLTVVFVLLVKNAVAMPLIFKAEKEVKIPNSPENVVTLDTSKVDDVRVAVVLIQSDSNVNFLEKWFDISFIEEDEVIPFVGFALTASKAKQMTTIQNVPAKLQFTMKSAGTYRIYVWGR